MPGHINSKLLNIARLILVLAVTLPSVAAAAADSSLSLGIGPSLLAARYVKYYLNWLLF